MLAKGEDESQERNVSSKNIYKQQKENRNNKRRSPLVGSYTNNMRKTWTTEGKNKQKWRLQIEGEKRQEENTNSEMWM